MSAPENVLVAADSARQHLTGWSDTRALVLDLLNGAPPEEVAVLMARVIEAHREGAELVRVLTVRRTSTYPSHVQTVAASIFGKQTGRYTHLSRGYWRYASRRTRGAEHTYHAEADARKHLASDQPLPEAVVQFVHEDR